LEIEAAEAEAEQQATIETCISSPD